MEKQDPLPARGMLLIANGSLRDPNFNRSVVLLAEHGEKGSYGLILNRPTEVLLSEAFAGNDLFKDVHDKLFYGGPCEPGRIQVLHDCDAADLKAYKVCDGVYMGGDVDMLMRMRADTGSDIRCRFYSGYSGWDEAQLDGEMESKSWILHPAGAAVVFDRPSGGLWSGLLTLLGEYYALVARMPADPRAN